MVVETQDPGKIVLDLVIAGALGGDAVCDIVVLRAQPGVLGSVASDPTVSRLVGRLAQDAERALGAITRACGAGMGKLSSVALQPPVARSVGEDQHRVPRSSSYTPVGVTRMGV